MEDTGQDISKWNKFWIDIGMHQHRYYSYETSRSHYLTFVRDT